MSHLPARLLLELAALQHQGLRARLPDSDIEAQQAEDLAKHTADWFATRARWTAPDEDGIFLSVDEVAVAQEQLIAARHMLLTAGSITTDEEVGEIVQGARVLLEGLVRLLAATPPESFVKDIVQPRGVAL